MVNKTKVFDIISRHVSFFEKIISKSEIVGDRNRAGYGLKEVKAIQFILDSNPVLSNCHLKQIHNRLTNMTRGVEYFDEYENEKKRRELGKEVYFVKQELEKYTKW